MEKLIEMIQSFAEQAKLPVEQAADSIVRAYHLENVMGAFVAVFFFVAFALALFAVVRIVFHRVSGWDEIDREFGGIFVIGGCCILVVGAVVSLHELGQALVGVMEPAGHLMKTFLVK